VGATVLIVAVDAGGTNVDPIGIGAALAAGLGYATYSVTSKATMERGLGSTAAMAIPFTIGVILVIALALAQAVSEPASWLATGEGLAMALYLGVVATGLAYVLFGFGLRRLTSASAVTLVLAEPLTAALLAALVLDESIPLGRLDRCGGRGGGPRTRRPQRIGRRSSVTRRRTTSAVSGQWSVVRGLSGPARLHPGRLVRHLRVHRRPRCVGDAVGEVVGEPLDERSDRDRGIVDELPWIALVGESARHRVDRHARRGR
jgi:hypothetical protein